MLREYQFAVYLWRNGDWRRARLEKTREDAERTREDWRREHGREADIRIEERF